MKHFILQGMHHRTVGIIILLALIAFVGCKSAKKEDSKATKTPPKHEPKTAEVKPGGYMLPFFDGQKWGFMDTKTRVAIQAQFDMARPFQEGLAAIRVGTDWGYIDTTGKLVIPATFNRGGDFKSGRARIRIETEGPRGFIDRKGNVVIPPDTNVTVKDFSEGLCPVIVSKKYGYVDTTGEMVIPNKFNFAGNFSGGRAAVQVDTSYGVIDRSGNFVLPPKFLYVDSYAEGLARARIRQKDHTGIWCFINEKGEVAFMAPYDEVRSFKEGRAAFKSKNLWGYLDTNGKPVVSAQFDFAMDYSDGLAAVRIARAWGYIDPAGGIVISPQFNIAEQFKHDIAYVTWPGGKFGYINTKGETLWSIVGVGTDSPIIESDIQ